VIVRGMRGRDDRAPAGAPRRATRSPV
jgi:hypothetical protein